MTRRRSLYARPVIVEESNAPRRGLADGATEQAPGSAVGSLVLAGTSPSPSADGADHRSTVRRPNGQSGSRDRPGSLSGMPSVSRSPCPRTRSLHASGVQCPVSGVTVQCRRRRCPRVGCPMSGVDVRCPASLSARRRPAVSAPVSSWSSSVRRAGTWSGGGLNLAVLPYPRTARPSA